MMCEVQVCCVTTSEMTMVIVVLKEAPLPDFAADNNSAAQRWPTAGIDSKQCKMEPEDRMFPKSLGVAASS